MTQPAGAQEPGTISWREGLLALADGSIFEGEVLGFDPPAAGAHSGSSQGPGPRRVSKQSRPTRRPVRWFSIP